MINHAKFYSGREMVLGAYPTNELWLDTQGDEQQLGRSIR